RSSTDKTRIHVLHQKHFVAKQLVYRFFDVKATIVPTRNKRSVKTRHGFGFHNEILKTFVHGGAEVDRTIGVRRTIMQDVSRRALTGLTNALVDVHLLPAGQQFGLVLRQIGLHGEGGLGQIDSGFQVERHSLAFSQMIDFFHYREGGKLTSIEPLAWFERYVTRGTW